MLNISPESINYKEADGFNNLKKIESYNKPLLTFDVNCRGTLNILEVVKNAKFIRSLISITSDKCYENTGRTKGYKETDVLGGVDPYSASKASAELIIRAYRESFFKQKMRCGVSSARAGNVIGGGDWSDKRLIPDCIRFIRNNSKIKFPSLVVFGNFLQKCCPEKQKLYFSSISFYL